MPKWKINPPAPPAGLDGHDCSRHAGIHSRRWFLMVAASASSVGLAQVSDSGIMSPNTRRVSARLACLCGACKNTVGDCPMLECSYCSPLRKKIAAMQADGKSDQSIVDAIVAETGTQALAAPPTQGFSLAAWTMPFVAIALGLAAVLMFMQRISRRPAVAAPEIDPAVLEKYHDRIEKDLAKFD